MLGLRLGQRKELGCDNGEILVNFIVSYHRKIQFSVLDVQGKVAHIAHLLHALTVPEM
jgi:hypothetical protein